MTKLGKLWSLSRSEWLVLLEALVVLPALAVLLRLAGLRRTQALLLRVAPVAGPGPGSGPAGADDRDPPGVRARARRVARMVRAAAAHGPYRANCLKQSLTLWWLLRRRGIASDLRIGVQKSTSGLEAHAWVEHSGVVLNDRDDVHQRYPCFDRAVEPGAVLGTS
jgi:hypothetical protein